MCQCNPSIRTLWCGEGTCIQPKEKRNSAEFDLEREGRSFIKFIADNNEEFYNDSEKRAKWFLEDFLERKEAFDSKKEMLIKKHSENLQEVLDLCEIDEYYKIVFEPLLKKILKK